MGNKVIWEDGEFIAMIVGGPNARTDFHIDQSPEFFYQIEGDMVLKVVDDDGHRDIDIRAGQIFLLPGGVPHSPRRPENTVGLVIERRREPDQRDGFVWYCDVCGEKLFETHLYVSDIEGQLADLIERYQANDELRTCPNCGHVNPAQP